VGLHDQTSVEFLNLAVLQVERLLAENQGASTQASASAPAFKALVMSSAELAGKTYDVNEKEHFADELKSSYGATALHDLPTTKRNPFKEEEHFSHREACGRFLLRVFFNYAVARNYAAHHDCLDEEILGSRLAARGESRCWR
jgi:hypothetical protein